MLTGPRSWATGAFSVAALAALVSSSSLALVLWMLPGLALTGWVQWVAWRGGEMQRARLWFATAPLWILSVVPLLVAVPLGIVDRLLYVGGVVVGATMAQLRTVAHERLLDRMYGPVARDTPA